MAIKEMSINAKTNSRPILPTTANHRFSFCTRVSPHTAPACARFPFCDPRQRCAALVCQYVRHARNIHYNNIYSESTSSPIRCSSQFFAFSASVRSPILRSFPFVQSMLILIRNKITSRYLCLITKNNYVCSPLHCAQAPARTPMLVVCETHAQRRHKSTQKNGMRKNDRRKSSIYHEKFLAYFLSCLVVYCYSSVALLARYASIVSIRLRFASSLIRTIHILWSLKTRTQRMIMNAQTNRLQFSLNHHTVAGAAVVVVVAVVTEAMP